MATKETILTLAEGLIKDKGINAFSFHDLSKKIGIRTASIHYHFPTKTDLCCAVVKENRAKLENMKKDLEDSPPTEKLEAFFSIYSKLKEKNQVCLVGSLATDLNTVDPEIKTELRAFAEDILIWVSSILEEGKDAGVFHFPSPPKTKAIMVISSMLAAVQLGRLTEEDHLNTIKNNILQELLKTHHT